MQADPIGYPDGANRYQLEVGNPLAFVDPMGLEGSGQGEYNGNLTLQGYDHYVTPYFGDHITAVYAGDIREGTRYSDGNDWVVPREQWVEYHSVGNQRGNHGKQGEQYLGGGWESIDDIRVKKPPSACYMDDAESYIQDDVTRQKGLAALMDGLRHLADSIALVNPIISTRQMITGTTASDAEGSCVEAASMNPLVLGAASVVARKLFDGAMAAWRMREAEKTAEAVARAETCAKWTLGKNHSGKQWANKMASRGWTNEQITEAIQNGQRITAPNQVNPGNSASRYIHPITGRSVVIDDGTGEVIHVGGDGFGY